MFFKVCYRILSVENILSMSAFLISLLSRYREIIIKERLKRKTGLELPPKRGSERVWDPRRKPRLRSVEPPQNPLLSFNRRPHKSWHLKERLSEIILPGVYVIDTGFQGAARLLAGYINLSKIQKLREFFMITKLRTSTLLWVNILLRPRKGFAHRAKTIMQAESVSLPLR